jgi:hypothetical protein
MRKSEHSSYIPSSSLSPHLDFVSVYTGYLNKSVEVGRDLFCHHKFHSWLSSVFKLASALTILSFITKVSLGNYQACTFLKGLANMVHRPNLACTYVHMVYKPRAFAAHFISIITNFELWLSELLIPLKQFLLCH